MATLKIVFLALLCLPLFYIAILLFEKLLTGVQIKSSEAAEKNRSRMRNVIDSDRTRYNQGYYQSRMGHEVLKRGTRNERKQRVRPRGRER